MLSVSDVARDLVVGVACVYDVCAYLLQSRELFGGTPRTGVVIWG